VPRDNAGNFTLIAGNPVTTGTAISSAWANGTLTDAATALSDSKSRSGKGDFTAPVRGADGSAAAPTWSFTNGTDAGLYRIGAGDIGFAIAGVKVMEWTATATTIVQATTLPLANGAVGTPSLSFFSETNSGLYRNALNDIRFAVNGVDLQRWGTTFSIFPSGAALRIDGTTSAGSAGFWAAANATAPTSTNYSIAINATNSYLNGQTGGNALLQVAGTSVVTVAAASVTIAQPLTCAAITANATANANGITAAGNGPGAGVQGTAGGTAGSVGVIGTTAIAGCVGGQFISTNVNATARGAINLSSQSALVAGAGAGCSAGDICWNGTNFLVCKTTGTWTLLI
jgi:hypothetical protein